ncbi:MAG TPA: hypothetical protein VJN42_12115 [Candidatus Acidoferrum sp.]|nr:hypothetical protein [Candidatus Acidoferrum sp.]
MNPAESRRRGWLEGILIVWILGSQAWYYLQFRDQFGSLLSLLLRKPWH